MAKEKRLQVRLDEELFNESQNFAEETGINVNQLVRALLRWAVDNGRPGKEPVPDEDGYINERRQTGVAWFGHPGSIYMTDRDREMVAEYFGIHESDVERQLGLTKGDIKLVLDFTERRAIRHGSFRRVVDLE